jgi:hypothetical protein
MNERNEVSRVAMGCSPEVSNAVDEIIILELPCPCPDPFR